MTSTKPTDASTKPTDASTNQNHSMPNDRLRKTYQTLFHEMQFRCKKNALMNYDYAEVLDKTGRQTNVASKVLAGASGAGLLAGIFQRGKILTNRFGMAGIAGMPFAAAVEVFTNSTSEFMPSYQERARKHIQAAASWNRISDRARAARLRLQDDPAFTADKYVVLHEELLQLKADVAKTVVIPKEIHRKFNENPEKVFASIHQAKEAFIQFKDFHMSEKKQDTDDKGDETFYL